MNEVPGLASRRRPQAFRDGRLRGGFRLQVPRRARQLHLFSQNSCSQGAVGGIPMNRCRSCWLLFTSLAVASTSFGALAQPPAGPGGKGTRIQGRVVRVQAPNQFLVRMAQNKEVVLYVNPQTRYLLNQRAAQFADLRAGAVVTALYEATDGRNVVSSVTFVEAAPVPPAVEKPGKPTPPVEKKPAPAEAAEESGKEVQIKGMITS